MGSAPSTVHWSVGLAALVGGLAGSLAGASTSIDSYGPAPIVGGGAAIYVGSLLGAIAGVGAAALVAFALARSGSPRVGAIAGAVAGTGLGALFGTFAEGLAQGWIGQFRSAPLGAAFVGGALAGALLGIAAGAAVRVFQREGAPVKRVVQFGGLLGSLGGLLAGIGGASVGVTLAEATSVCPNGYFTDPYVASGCAQGLLQGSLLLGLWGGALTGALAGLASAEVLTLIAARRPPSPSGT
ncbi:MAG TPA: hypothetical protein VMC82_05290 [Thermoplasmata archaeon]|nr:hypothetical protein [Thermoplasmata archaeon]